MQTQVTNIGTFVGGLNTEQPQLADQIQYTVDELNCQLLPDGTRARRYGLTREESGVGIPMSYTDEGEDSFFVQYNEPGEYNLNITEAGMYTVWMAGGGAEEDHQFAYDVQASGGGSLKAYVALEAGSYTVKVGHKGGTINVADNQKTNLENGNYYISVTPWWKSTVNTNMLHLGYKDFGYGHKRDMYTPTPGTPTSLYKQDYIDIVCNGGVSQALAAPWRTTPDAFSIAYQGLFTQNIAPYETFDAFRGPINLNKVPTQFSIVYRTTDNALHNVNSIFTNDTTGPGAINKDGFFKIMKGQIVDDSEGADVVNGKEINAYYWSNFDKKGTDCIVLQQGYLLRFYKAQRPYDSELIAQLDTTTQVTSGSFTRYAFSSGEGFLLAVSEYAEPFYVTLQESPASAVLHPINIQIRDLVGVNDSLAVDEQPTTLTNLHNYNLLNQGWDATKITAYYNSQTKYPSNALIWWLGKDNNGDFNVSNLTKVYFGSTPAPKGHFVLDYFNQDRSTVSGVSNIDVVKKDRYVCDVAFFAGRFFYLTSSTVLFSQVIKEDVRNIGKCYQDADPTSQSISDIIATDGGEIIFQELGYGKAIKKFPLGLVVFGDKSVYTIQSTAGNTFTATQYQTHFVTHAGAISGRSVVNAEDVLYYWSPQGIYQITVDQISGTQALASSVSANTVQQWYNNLPNFAKENCVGAYDYANRRIVWMYPTDEENLDIRDGVLVYYLDFQAFLPSKISIDGGKSYTVFETVIPSYIIPSISLYAGTDEIGAGTDDVIVKDFGGEYGRNFSVCYLGYITSYDRLFFCDFASREFSDFNIGLYNSYALSYPITFGSTFNKKYTPVAQCYFLRTEEDEMNDGTYLAPSSCYVRARWKWGENSDCHKWDLTQEGYIRIPRFMNFRYVNGKIRIKGSGPSMQLMLESKEDNDFKLSGINLEIRTV